METYVIEKWNTISKMAETFNDLSWVIKARSKDETRYNLHGVYFDGEAFVSTDGYRLHYALFDPDSLPKEMIPKKKGVYDVVTANKKAITLRLNKDFEFPDYSQILPDPKTFTNSQRCILGRMVTPLTTLARYTFSLFADKGCINLKYLEDLAIEDEEWEIFFIDYLSPVTFMNHSKLAILMPVRADIDKPSRAKGEVVIEAIPDYGRKFEVDRWGETVEAQQKPEPEAEDKENQDAAIDEDTETPKVQEDNTPNYEIPMKKKKQNKALDIILAN